MDEYAALYVGYRIWNRLYEFFRHWYVRSFLIYGHGVIGFLERLDETFAVRIMLRHFGEPLFQDRTAVGYILGFLFRSFRIVFGVMVYGIVVVVAFALYAVWCLIPPYLIYRIFF